jgi:hypothetical protein
METPAKGLDKSSWAVGGGVMLGLGAGFFFLAESVFAFVGCLLGGIGLGLMVAALASSRRG